VILAPPARRDDAEDSAALARLPRCGCGSAAMAFAPGTAPLHDAGVVRFPDGRQTLVDRGEPVRALCRRCWGRRFADLPLLADVAG
jgi:hypothetical protein